MRTTAAVIEEPGGPLTVTELELDTELRGAEVLVRYEYAGLCHSDLHIITGDLDVRTPMVIGHEGAGVVLDVGPDVTRVRPGDHLVASFIPACGTCRYCAQGAQSVCDNGAEILAGNLPGDRWPLSGPRGQYGAMCMLGTFSQYGVIHENSVVRIDDDIPLDVAALVGCGVPTGWGSAVNTAEVAPGETVVVYGAGGIGVNAVQGARHAGAKHVIVVDPVEYKRERAEEFGATHTFAEPREAFRTVVGLTRGQLADASIVTTGVVAQREVRDAFNIVGKLGRVVVTGMNRADVANVQLSGTLLAQFRKSIRGSLFGDCNPTVDIPRLLSLYQSGDLLLDELITTRYSIDRLGDGYADLVAGKNVRGLLVLEH